MLSDEEALNLEHEIRNLLPKEIVDVATLKRILRDGLGGFEELLKELSSHDREAALSLYLQKMRDVAFRFHLAVLKMTLKDRHQRFSSREEMQACLKRSQQEMENVTNLYQLL